ncbi:MAG: GNAT family N-acetyltransferase, partial [Capnocytophaga endodontalis]
MNTNQYNQPIGDALPNFSVGETPHITLLEGNYCWLEPLSVAKHLDDLSDFYLESNAVMPDWTYLSIAPAKNKEELHALLTKQEASVDPYFLTIVDKQTQKAVGTLALMRIDPKNRVIEVGWVNYSSALQRTRMATEAQYLLAKYVFETLQYRRYEWKCDSLNAPSRRAAERLGFVYEGTFRQAVV